MKKSFYLLMMSIGLAFTACEPMEDIHNDLDARLDARPNQGTQDYTLSDEDYEELGLDNTFFTSVDEANQLLPDFLSEMYPVLGEGSIANVTAVVAQPLAYSLNVEEYVVSDEDYDAMGLQYGNFDNQGDLFDFLDYKFPDAQQGTIIQLTYEWYAGSTSTVTTDFLNTGDGWTQVFFLEREDYQAMGEAYANFDNREEAMQKISVYLNQLDPYTPEGTTRDVLFAVHIGGGNTAHYLETFNFDGAFWQGSFERTLQFGHNGSVWEPDNTIQYTLQPADFAAIGDALENVEGFEDPAWSAGNYNNFDRRRGNQNYWSDDMLLEAVNIVLDRIHPNAEEGQKYVVSFDIYDGSAGTESLSVVKEGGEWVRL